VSGYIQRFQDTEHIHVLVVSTGNNKKNSDIRIMQCESILSKHKITFELLNIAYSCNLAQSRARLAAVIEEEIKTFKPNKVLIPNSNDLHQDHKLVNELCKIASKPKRHKYIEEILEYCVPESEEFSATFFDTELQLTNNEHIRKVSDANIYSTEYIPFLPKTEKFKTIYRRL